MTGRKPGKNFTPWCTVTSTATSWRSAISGVTVSSSPVRARAGLVRDAHGKPLMVVGEVEDITQRERTRKRCSSWSSSRHPMPSSWWTRKAGLCWSIHRQKNTSATARDEMLGKPIEILIPRTPARAGTRTTSRASRPSIAPGPWGWGATCSACARTAVSFPSRSASARSRRTRNCSS